MRDRDKPKEQLMNELVTCRQRVDQLMRSEAELRQNQEMLRENETRYRTLVENSVEGIWHIDRDGYTAYLNRTMCAMLEIEGLEELSGTTYHRFFSAESVEIMKREHAKRSKGLGSSYEVEIVGKQGGRRNVLISGAPVLSSNNELLGLIGFFTDITERKKAEEERDRLFNFSIDMLCIAGFDGFFKQLNPAWSKTLGWKEKELQSKPWIDFVHPEDREATVSASKTLVDGTAVYAFENRYLCRDGSYRWISWNSFPLPEDNLIFAVARDISEQKRVKEMLRESEELYSNILESMSDGILTLNRDFYYTHCNRAMERIMKTSREKLVGSGMLPWEIFPHLTEQGVDEMMVKAMGGEISRRENIPYRLSDGTKTFTSEIYLPLKTTDGDIRGIIGVIRDVTEQMRAIEVSRETHQKLRALIEASPIAITLLDTDGNVTLWSPAAESIFGWKTDEVLGRPTPVVPKEKSTELKQNLRHVLQGKSIHGSEVRRRRKDGTSIDISLSVVPLRNAEGAISGAAAMMSDISERKKSEKELSRYREHLEDLVAERTRELEETQQELMKREKLAVLGQLTATVSHELRNPLGVIRSSAFYLKRNLAEANAKIVKHIDRIDKQVETCNAIVNDLLEYTRGRHSEMFEGDVNAWLAEVLKQIEKPAGVGLDCQFSPVLSPICMDQEKMQRVIINIMENAFQAVALRENEFGQRDGHYLPRISISTAQQPEGVVIQVVDNGIGMNEETVKRAFEPLFTTHARGTGLGLAVVAKIVKEHGGTVSLESKLSQGTKVTILMPVVQK